MIYTYISAILFVLYFEFACHIATRSPVIDWYDNIIDINDDLNRYRFVILTKLIFVTPLVLCNVIVAYSYIMYSMIFLQKSLDESEEKVISLIDKLIEKLDEYDEY